MKFRKLELRSVDIYEEVWNETTHSLDRIKQGKFYYRQALQTVILKPGRTGNLSTEEVVKSVYLYGKLKEALQKNTDYVLLTEEDWEYLKARIDNFPWAVAHEGLLEFINYIRGLPEGDYEVNEKTIQP